VGTPLVTVQRVQALVERSPLFVGQKRRQLRVVAKNSGGIHERPVDFDSPLIRKPEAGSGTDGDGHFYWGSGRPIWNNDGDTVFVRTDEGSLVLEVSYDG